MNKKKLIPTLILSVLGLAVLAFCLFWLNHAFESKTDGEIRILLVDIEGNAVSDETIAFNEGDSLDNLLKDNYENVVIIDGMIISIEDFETAADWSRFISIYVDDEMSMVGLMDIKFTDGTKIAFVMTKYVQQ